MLLISLNPSLAMSRGIQAPLIELIFTTAIAVIVTVSIQWVGILIINAFLVLPAAAARNIASNIKKYHVFSILFAVIAGITGLILSFYINTAAGATIVIILTGIYFITLAVKALTH